MLIHFINFIKEKKLFQPSDKILLAVSGGVDSIVLLHLFRQTEYRFGVVHCNFKLRGQDSDEDEKFVEEQIYIHGIPYYSTHFDTVDYARTHGISIEMAARELRYDFFEKTRKENGYDFIATAHHKDDLLETFFLNLSRKTGIKGLTGIKEKNGSLIRPLLFASRQDIEKYAQKYFLENREDATNSEVVYQRNFIRHKILPVLTSLNPAFKKNMYDTIMNLRDAEKVYNWYLNNEKNVVITQIDNHPAIEIKKLINTPFPEILLHEILSEFGFNPKVADQVFQSLTSEPGKLFYSSTQRLIKDRTFLYIVPLEERDQRIHYIEKGDIEIFSPFDIRIYHFQRKDFEIEKSPNIACIDQDKIEYPLLIRKWQAGDYFQPLGMTGFKKISDFLIDEKVPIHKKEDIWLLCSGQKIIWVMGYRLDNRYKITPTTQRVLKIQLLPQSESEWANF